MEKQELETIYRNHHERGARYGYLFCGGARVPFLKKWVGEGKKVLDLGCRDGMLTAGFAKGNEVVGADIDQKALGLCKERLGIETLWVDLNAEWPFEKEAFDVIVACEIMEHLFHMEGFLQKVSHSLKKGGVFIGSVPNAFRMRNRWKFLFGKEYENDPTHVRQFSALKLEKILSAHFTVQDIVPLEGKFAPLCAVGQNTPRWLGRLFAKDLLWHCIR